MQDQVTPKTEIVIAMDSGDTHTGFVTEEHLKLVRDALDGKAATSITITLYKSATENKNESVQLKSAKIESLKLL